MADLQEIRQHIADELEPAKNKGFYICPLCGSGTGPHHTAAFSIDRDKVHGKCFACNFYGDIFDLIAQRDGVSLAEATRRAAERYGGGNTPPPRTQSTQATQAAQEPPAAHDYTDYIKACNAAITGSEGEKYLHGRGFTDATIARFRLGYDKELQQIIIPYSRAGRYYSTRTITGKQFFKPRTEEAGPEPIFNQPALYSGSGPVFVVESPLCAISIMQAGGQAVALGGTGAGKLTRQLAAEPTQTALIISLDNDEAGEPAAAKLCADLQDLHVNAALGNVAGDHKDPNEALQAEPEAFTARVGEFIRAARAEQEAAEEAERQAYQQESAATYIDSILEDTRANTPAIQTGFSELDKALDGGLYEGLYILGAVSSLGKTTFALQMADQIAQQGRDVLIFSLEMARTELMAKSLSRLTVETADCTQDAKTTRGITDHSRQEHYSPQERRLITDCVALYKKYAQHVYISEGLGNIGTEQIRDAVARHIRITGNSPVVFIDYLQIIAPADVRATDKQNTDRAVFELKRISRDFKIPVFAISSLNRDNYTTKINLAAFKESGAIEYSSDVLLGLQFQAMNDTQATADSMDTWKRQDTRKIELKVLKYRNGPTGAQINFDYVPMFNIFTETGAADSAPKRRI